MVVDGRQVHPRPGDDAPKGRGAVALLGKKPFGCIENALFRVVHRVD
jgi:hypothetical protein